MSEEAARVLPSALPGQIIFGDNLPFLKTLQSGTIDLIYIDPPFNTGRIQCRKQIKTVHDDNAPDRIGFKGRGYRSETVGKMAFEDIFEDFEAFIMPRLEEAYRVLKSDGSLFLHIDYREVHYCKLYLDQIFGRPSFINEIIWAYDYGARSKSRWSPKHDNILWYAKNPKIYTFNFTDIDRIPYMAPELVGAEKAERGKTPSDTWWHTIVSPTGREKTGYPTQKPLGIIERIVRLHSNPGDTVLDFFAGSGTVGEACAKLGRKFILVDNNPEAFEVMKRRLEKFKPEVIVMPNTTDEPVDASAEIPAPNVHVIIAAVWDYENKALQGLSGPAKDVVMMKRFFDSTESNVGVHASKEVEVLENPTAEKLRAVLVNYQDTRSATGDILIFYFSGHGAVLGDQFVFCFKDTMIRPDGTYVPLTVLRFDDIVQTLAGAQVHPVFILDACFSGTAGANDLLSLVSAMHEKVRLASGRSYALLCACHAQGPAEDTPKGGAFTKALFDAGQAGLADKAHRRQKFLEVKDLSQSVQARLTREGFPLPKSWFGDDLPSFPLVRNVAFQPRIETLMPHHGQTLDLLWNNGNPRTVTITDIRENCGQSAYGNHRKLSWGWNLVENAGDSKHRRLTELGKRFMAGDLKVSEVIEWDPVKSVWRAAKDARQIARSEIGATKALMARVRKHSSKRTRKQ